MLEDECSIYLLKLTPYLEAARLMGNKELFRGFRSLYTPLADPTPNSTPKTNAHLRKPQFGISQNHFQFKKLVLPS